MHTPPICDQNVSVHRVNNCCCMSCQHVSLYTDDLLRYVGSTFLRDYSSFYSHILRVYALVTYKLFIQYSTLKTRRLANLTRAERCVGTAVTSSWNELAKQISKNSNSCYRRLQERYL